MSQSPVSSFQYAATTIPYYKSVLKDRGVDPALITDMDSFSQVVPIVRKEDIFVNRSLSDLCAGGMMPAFRSAIVSSGTSGTFSFGILTDQDVSQQVQMVDMMLEQFFQAADRPTIVINALPMGVSFSSSYPVIPTGVRSDIVLKVIDLFGASHQIVLITDPHILKQVLEEGIDNGISWSQYRLSAIVGGTWSSESYAQYIHTLLNPAPTTADPRDLNQLYATMGITEVGLNLFAGTPDLLQLRSALQQRPEDRKRLLGGGGASPLLMYVMSSQVYMEVINPDDAGIGELVVTHLDTSVTPCLVRYATGDRVKFITSEELTEIGFTPLLSAPVVAVYGRVTDEAVNEIKQVLYTRPDLVSATTGNFILEAREGGRQIVQYQVKRNKILPLEQDIDRVQYCPVSYNQFESGVSINYDYKWRHYH